MGKDASENPIRVVKVERLRVGESGDRLVRAEKALQQVERRILSHRKSRKSGKREENLQSSAICDNSIEVFRERTNQGCSTFGYKMQSGKQVAGKVVAKSNPAAEVQMLQSYFGNKH